MTESINWDHVSRLDKLQSVIDSHDGKGSKNLLIDRIHWNAIRKHLSGSKNLLDFGCGIGRFARRIHSRGITYTGIDNSLGMIRKAGSLRENRGLNFKHFDGVRIPFPENHFDTILITEVLIYILRSPVGSVALSEIYRVLAPRGRLVLLEQASISGRKSESASAILTEDDYTTALSKFFKINSLYKVRSPDFSHWTCRILESPKVSLSLFSRIVGPVAYHESALVKKATDDYFKTTSYYDFLIDATVVKSK